MGWVESDLRRHELAEARWEASCKEADCGHLIPEGEYYYDVDGEILCKDCARGLAETVDDWQPHICVYCGAVIEADEECLTYGGEYYHEDCWDESVEDFGRYFGGWEEDY